MKNSKRFKRYKFYLKKWDNFGVRQDEICPLCGKADGMFYYERLDAVCCVLCNEWIDEKCGDTDCPYCAARPDTPYEAFLYDSEKSCPILKKERLRQAFQRKFNEKLRRDKKRKFFDEMN